MSVKSLVIIILQLFGVYYAGRPSIFNMPCEHKACNSLGFQNADDSTLRKELLDQYSWTSCGLNFFRLKWLTSFDAKRICNCVIFRNIVTPGSLNDQSGRYEYIRNNLQVDKESITISSSTFTKYTCTFEDTQLLVFRGYRKTSFLTNTYNFYVGTASQREGGVTFKTRIKNAEPSQL